MVNRWENRIEPKAGHGQLYWHILLGDQPQIRALASMAREKLAGFSGLHFTPYRWLHITTLVAGPADDFTSNQITEMTDQAQRNLSELSPITISLSKILYHPEAIVLQAEPDGALDLAHKAIRHATYQIKKKGQVVENSPWHPHVTLAYSTAVQSTNPIIAALGRYLPACEADIKSVSLVTQKGAERQWNWYRIAEVSLGTK